MCGIFWQSEKNEERRETQDHHGGGYKQVRQVLEEVGVCPPRGIMVAASNQTRPGSDTAICSAGSSSAKRRKRS